MKLAFEKARHAPFSNHKESNGTGTLGPLEISPRLEPGLKNIYRY